MVMVQFLQPSHFGGTDSPKIPYFPRPRTPQNTDLEAAMVEAEAQTEVNPPKTPLTSLIPAERGSGGGAGRGRGPGRGSPGAGTAPGERGRGGAPGRAGTAPAAERAAPGAARPQGPPRGRDRDISRAAGGRRRLQVSRGDWGEDQVPRGGGIQVGEKGIQVPPGWKFRYRGDEFR